MQIKIGDVVVTQELEFWEPLYLNYNKMDMDNNDIYFEWKGEPALVIDVIKHSRSYNKLKLMIYGKTGWTYSDYVKLIYQV